MGVQDYLSLYTILLGWQVYDGLWDILTQLGLVMLPFGFIAARCFLAPYLSMGAKDAGVVGARRFVFHTFTALFILMIAGVPMVHLDPQILHFKPDCSTDGRVLTPGNTGTTYDDVLPVPQDIKVPLLWYVVLAVSNGITDQAKEIISCQPVDLRALQNELNLTQIKDTELKTEISQFYSSCYLPAYNKFVSENSDQTLQQQIDDSLDTYGKDDIGWIGSRTFQNISGFYDSFYATKEVPNFASDSSDPHDQINSQVGAPDWGEPLCKTWWQDSRYGLRIRLLNEFDDQSKEALTKIYSGGDEVYVQDAVIRAVIMKSTNSGAFNRGYASEEDSKNGTMNAYGKWGAKGYTEKATLSEYPKIHILENMLPVLQAVILFAVIMLLALALPLSCYAPGFCVTASVFLFSITFCGFLWHAISWFDQFMLQALYGFTDLGAHADPAVSFVKNLTVDTVNPQKNLVDITISIMYIIIPTLWLTVAGWASVAIGGALAGLGGGKGTAEKIGNSTAAGTLAFGKGTARFFNDNKK